MKSVAKKQSRTPIFLVCWVVLNALLLSADGNYIACTWAFAVAALIIAHADADADYDKVAGIADRALKGWGEALEEAKVSKAKLRAGRS